MTEVQRQEEPAVETLGSSAEPLTKPAEGSEGASGVAESESKEAGKAPVGTPPSEAEPASKGAWPKSAVDRVAKLTARLREYEARGAGAPRPIDPSTGVQFTQEQIESMAQERAVIIAQQTNFNSRCNEAARRGAQKFPDWQPKLDGLTRLVDQTDQRSIQTYNMFLETALETGEAEAIIHHLGSDLNEGARILALPPAKMMMEVAKLGAGLAKPSVDDALAPKLPKPIRPVGSSSPSTATRPDDPERGAELPMDQWMKAREAQAKERRIR